LIPVFVVIFRLLKFTVERTISCHSSAVSFSESTDRLTDLELETCCLPRCVINPAILYNG
jgi:hypothetical protein